MKKILAIFLIAGSAVFVSCTKSGALTGSGAGSSSSFGTITGSANGGLSPLSGASVNLYLGGSSTPIASATTAADGSFSIVFNGQTSGNFLYLTITGGNAGSGTNSNNQLMSIVGTSGAPLSSLKVNEMSTAATELVGMNMGLLNDTNGTITLNAPKNAAGASNVVTQFGNLIANGNLNTSNSNLTTSAQTGLAVTANAFAACIENSSNCSKLFADAKTSTGTNALTVLESGYYALLNSSNVASSLYTLAFPFNSTTGYTLTSAGMPGGFTFNNPLAASVTTLNLSGFNSPQILAFDASGNAWMCNAGANNVLKLSPNGALLGTFAAGGQPTGIAIDASGNAWVPTYNNNKVVELSSSGTTLGTFSTGTGPIGAAIDLSGNIYVGGSTGTTVTKLSPTGTALGSFITGSSGPRGIVVDSSGFLWVAHNVSKALVKMDTQGNVINTIALPSADSGALSIDQQGNLWASADSYGSGDNGTFARVTPSGTVTAISLASLGVSGTYQSAVDPNGNVWVTTGDFSSSGVIEINSSGLVLAQYLPNHQGRGLAVDPNGDVWTTAYGENKTYIINAAASGPNFFPVTGPQWPYGNI